MNKRIDFTNLGGYPLAQEDLDWLQSSFRSAFGMIATMVGDLVIVTGMEDVAGVLNPGWVSIGGELLPFAGGAIGGGEIAVVETATPLTFKDGNSKDVLYEKVAQFSAGGAYDYADFKRLSTLINIWQTGDIKEKICSMPYLAANFDVDGYGINREVGWRILSKEIPDTAGKVFVNLDDADPDFDTIGNVGGEKEHVLTENEMASHDHILSGGTGASFAGSGAVPGINPGGSESAGSTGFAGGDDPHNNLQPYYVVLKLYKL